MTLLRVRILLIHTVRIGQEGDLGRLHVKRRSRVAIRRPIAPCVKLADNGNRIALLQVLLYTLRILPPRRDGEEIGDLLTCVVLLSGIGCDRHRAERLSRTRGAQNRISRQSSKFNEQIHTLLLYKFVVENLDRRVIGDDLVIDLSHKTLQLLRKRLLFACVHLLGELLDRGVNLVKHALAFLCPLDLCRLLLDRRNGHRLLFGIILAGIDEKTQTVTRDGLDHGPLNGFVDIEARDVAKRDGCVSHVHHRQILDVLKLSAVSLFISVNERYTNLDPGCLPVVVIVVAILVLVDGVVAVRINLLQLSPCPCPALVGQSVLLFDLVAHIEAVEYRE